MKERQQLDTLEQLLKPRQIFTVNTGDGEYVENEINRFFDSVINALGYNVRARKAFVERKSFVLHQYDETSARPTDDRITLLIARNRVVASLLETRDDFNYIQVSSASYLNPEMIRGIGERIVKK